MCINNQAWSYWQNGNRDSTGPRPLSHCNIGTAQDQYTVNNIRPTLYFISPPALN